MQELKQGKGADGRVGRPSVIRLAEKVVSGLALGLPLRVSVSECSLVVSERSLPKEKGQVRLGQQNTNCKVWVLFAAPATCMQPVIVF